MPENRFFLDAPFQKGLTLDLPQEELHHLRVMRIHPNDTFDLVNGQNQLATVRLEKGTSVVLLEVITKPPPKHQLILAQAFLRPKNLEFVIEKGTELGATAFWLFPASRSEKGSPKLARLRQLTISALKQCGRLDLPQIKIFPDLPKPLPGTAFFGNPGSKTLLSPSSTDTTLFIGPEKGFSPEEENHLHKALKAKGIRLNPHILRAETAALCGLSLLAINENF
ncbi:MAG: Ribosomal RNA small subunit methyltransferase E [Chlamydiae bacterium]|nr:Ribosomal RNA small subunit methyltransferase E [Chlamydiota bacterium]